MSRPLLIHAAVHTERKTAETTNRLAETRSVSVSTALHWGTWKEAFLRKRLHIECSLFERIHRYCHGTSQHGCQYSTSRTMAYHEVDMRRCAQGQLTVVRAPRQTIELIGNKVVDYRECHQRVNT